MRHPISTALDTNLLRDSKFLALRSNTKERAKNGMNRDPNAP